jgi:hypothetical protein
MKGRNFIFSNLDECVHTVFRIVSNMFLGQKFDLAFEPGPYLVSCPRFRLMIEDVRCDDVVHILMVKFETYQIQMLTSCFVLCKLWTP